MKNEKKEKVEIIDHTDYYNNIIYHYLPLLIKNYIQWFIENIYKSVNNDQIL